MSEINFGKKVSLKQAAEIILSTPMNRYLLQGEAGIGKSSIIKALQAALPNHGVAYIDVPNMDLGDVAMPVIDHDTKTTRYYPNNRFGFHTGKPMIVMLDEYTKGFEPVKNMLHPLLEINNPRLGDIPVHPDSIIFMTGNLSSDGVGDSMKAHTRNRIQPITVAKPDFDQWSEWAMDADIAPEVLAWGKQFSHIFASYTDGGQGDNPYIFNPRKVQDAFVSPRSLERASHIIKVRKQLDTDSVIAALTGAIGESGARDLQAYLEFSDQLPTWEATIKSPKTATVPTSAGACAIVAYGAIQKVDKDTMAPFMQYLERMDAEWQAVFCIGIARNKTKQGVAFGCKAFADWVAKNEDLL